MTSSPRIMRPARSAYRTCRKKGCAVAGAAPSGTGSPPARPLLSTCRRWPSYEVRSYGRNLLSPPISLVILPLRWSKQRPERTLRHTTVQLRESRTS